MMNFGENLRRIRRARDITQGELADAIGVCQPLIAQYEKNAKLPPLGTAFLMAEFLGCTIDELTKETKEG